MGPQITVSAHALVKIRKPYKIGLGYEVLEAGVCFGVLNGMKGQIIQRKKKKTGGTEVNLDIFSEWL